MANKRILIIEDEKEMVTALATFLKPQGFEVIAAYDAMYGTKLARKETVDLIILDLALPAGGGLFVLKNIRESVSSCMVPIIVLTATSEKGLEEKAQELGVSAFVHKPFEPEVLLNQIKKLLGAG